MKILLYFLFALICLSACSYINKKLGVRDDNIIEEIIEEGIESKTGIDIDLTPQSPEPNIW